MAQTIQRTPGSRAGMRPLARGLAAVAVAVALIAGGAQVPADAATRAAATCVRMTPGVTDPYGHHFTGKTRCNNATPAPVFQTTNASSASAQKAMLLTDPSWFLCWKVGGWYSDPELGSSNYWYYTEGDRTLPGRSNAWGFVPGAYLNQDIDPINWTPQCTFAWVPA